MKPALTPDAKARIAAAGKARWGKFVADRKDQEAAAAEELPPSDDAAERGALGCILEAAGERDADSMLASLRGELFYDNRHRKLFDCFIALRLAHRAVDLTTVSSHLGRDGLAAVGGLPYLTGLGEAIPSVANFPYYVSSLEDQAVFRDALSATAEVRDLIRARNREGGADLVKASMKVLGELFQKSTPGERPKLLITDPITHLSYEPNHELRLIGDNEIVKGYEGVCVIGGPAGSGKSMVASSLALAGAIGKGEWMGRKVHRQFRTLIIQCENGAIRLRMEFERMRAENPGVDLKRWIHVSLPPEGGIPFHHAEFRRAVKAAVAEFRPDVVVIDPWTAVAAEDGAKDVVDKLAEIRACLPPGDDCPALVIVAHTRKPKAEGMRRGRGLLNELSGSLALGATARCAYVLLPFTDDIKDSRVLWACAKLSNGEAMADSVWNRKLGGLFTRAPDDPAQFWEQDGPAERTAVSKDQLREVFGERVAMSRKDLVAALQKAELCSYQTAMRSTGPTGYMIAREWLKETPGGLLALER